MSQINLFNGGLNKKMQSHLIAVNEAQVCTNADLSTGSLIPYKKDTDEDLAVGKTIIYFKGKWVSNPDKVNYVVFQDRLYYSSGNIPQKSNDGLTWYNLGIVKPASAPNTQLVQTGNLTGDYQYCYTYYNSSDGAESQPSTYSVVLTATADKFNVGVVASSDPQVDKIRVYRLGGGFTAMSLAAEIANTTQTYEDNVSDINIAATPLVSQYYSQAPMGLQYLTEHNAMFFGAVADKLYFSEIAFVNAWSPYNFIDFEENITGLGAMQNGLLVFTQFKTYIITGTSPQSLSKFLLNGNNGCILHDSIKYVGNNLVWLSNDSFCTSSGSDVTPITLKKLGRIDFNYPTNAVVNEEVYYLSHQDGIFIIDFINGGTFSEITGTADSFWILNDKLYYALDSKLYSLFSSKYNRELVYKTADFSDGSITNIKNYKTVYVFIRGSIVMTTLINSDVVNSTTLVEGLNEVKVPQETKNGYYISFIFQGTGSVLELEYKVEGRQNGR